MAFKVITGFERYHKFNKGDVVELTRPDYPIQGLSLYTRKIDGLVQALDANDVEKINE